MAKLLIPPELFLPRQENGFRDLNIVLTGNQKLLFTSFTSVKSFQLP